MEIMLGKRRADKCHIYRPADFEKAFDKVPHQLLLQKLKLYKVDPSIINGIKAFLCFRKQKARLFFQNELKLSVEFHKAQS